ncbi:MAG TPA: DUF1592 domain-containing protein [Acidobacteria bacterium]|nr:DUF1592 domain-containing protein [Acidobacteriota bacterium]
MDSRPHRLDGSATSARVRQGVVAAVVMGLCLAPTGVSRAAAQTAAATAADSPRAVLDRYCVTCHNERTLAGGLALDTADPGQVGHDPALWEKVAGKLRTGMMPPERRPRPDASTYTSLVSYFETALDQTAALAPNPGRPAAHRLNRAEYTNAVRDLLGLEIDGRALLPADESGYGFDNIADVLSLSPGLLERYLLAAAKISRQAVGDPTLRPTTAIYKTSPLLSQTGRVSDDLPLGSRGGLAVEHHFPLDGEYLLKVSLRGRARAPHQLEIRIDRERVATFALGDRPTLEVRLPISAGTRLVGVSFAGFIGQSLPVDARPPPPPITSYTYVLYPNDPAVEQVEILGPYDGVVPADTSARQRIFACRPSSSAATAEDERLCASEIVTALATRAYRRPATEADVASLLAAYDAGRLDGGGFEDGIRWTIESLLVSPKFLFRIEDQPATATPGAPYRISDIDLAARLSFFLWSTIPDSELIDLAAEARLSDPDVLEQQVRRMLADPRSGSLVENFAGQWLYLRNLPTVAPDATQFPEFDDNLRHAFRRETELFFNDQFRGDHSVRDLLSADYTFVNERLARHYGIPNVYGGHFRRVTWPEGDTRRAGLLGQGSLLTVTSYPHRTSPVVRGKWLLENLLGAPPPPPPADVPGLEEPVDQERAAGMRERMAQHRSNPVCASCHARIDPLGFALENFDAVGRWRETEGGAGTAIDASGAMPDGAAFDGPAAFRAALLAEPWAGEFTRTVTGKLLTYALGRGLEFYDAPVVRQIMRDAEPDGHRWSSLILGIVKSVPFQMRRADPASPGRVEVEQAGP